MSQISNHIAEPSTIKICGYAIFLEDYGEFLCSGDHWKKISEYNYLKDGRISIFQTPDAAKKARHRLLNKYKKNKIKVKLSIIMVKLHTQRSLIFSQFASPISTLMEIQ